MFRRKAQFPQAYHCSFSSSMLPEIDGVMGWTKASHWKAINYFLAVEGDITIRSVGWLGPLAELSSTCFYDRRGGAGGCTWRWISNSSGAGIASLSLSPSHIDQCSVLHHLLLIKLVPLLVSFCFSHLILSGNKYITILNNRYFECMCIFECNMSVLLGWPLEYYFTSLDFISFIDSVPVTASPTLAG